MTYIVDTVVMGHTAKAVWRITHLIVTALLVGFVSCLYINKLISIYVLTQYASLKMVDARAWSAYQSHFGEDRTAG